MRDGKPELGIIVPYRDRADHLHEFLSETTRFFATNPVNAGISPRFLIVEQAPGLGFRLVVPQIEYVCLHDAYRVPLKADYRWPEQPMIIIVMGCRCRQT